MTDQIKPCRVCLSQPGDNGISGCAACCAVALDPRKRVSRMTDQRKPDAPSNADTSGYDVDDAIDRLPTNLRDICLALAADKLAHQAAIERQHKLNAAAYRRKLIEEGRKHDERMTNGPWIEEFFYRDGDDLIKPHRWRIFLVGHDNPRTNSRDCDWNKHDAAGIAWMRTNLRAILDGYAMALDAAERDEREFTSLIDTRDHREQQINEIADALGDESEWSNLNDRGDNACELAEALVQERDKLRRDYQTVANSLLPSSGGPDELASEVSKLRAALETARDDVEQLLVRQDDIERQRDAFHDELTRQRASVSELTQERDAAKTECEHQTELTSANAKAIEMLVKQRDQAMVIPASDIHSMAAHLRLMPGGGQLALDAANIMDRLGTALWREQFDSETARKRTAMAIAEREAITDKLIQRTAELEAVTAERDELNTERYIAKSVDRVTELLSEFQTKHTALHKQWTAEVGNPGYDKAKWRDADNALAAEYKSLLGVLGYRGPLIAGCR